MQRFGGPFRRASSRDLATLGLGVALLVLGLVLLVTDFGEAAWGALDVPPCSAQRGDLQ